MVKDDYNQNQKDGIEGNNQKVDEKGIQEGGESLSDSNPASDDAEIQKYLEETMRETERMRQLRE